MYYTQLTETFPELFNLMTSSGSAPVMQTNAILNALRMINMLTNPKQTINEVRQRQQNRRSRQGVVSFLISDVVGELWPDRARALTGDVDVASFGVTHTHSFSISTSLGSV